MVKLTKVGNFTPQGVSMEFEGLAAFNSKWFSWEHLASKALGVEVEAQTAAVDREMNHRTLLANMTESRDAWAIECHQLSAQYELMKQAAKKIISGNAPGDLPMLQEAQYTWACEVLKKALLPGEPPRAAGATENQKI